MNVLMVGSGKGSWEVRGRQLGAVLDGFCTKKPTDEELQRADVVVLIKRVDPTIAARARAFGKPVVWDALDFWQQPEQNALTQDEALVLLYQQLQVYQPDHLIAATDAMAVSAWSVSFKSPASYLPHHARPGLTPGPVRETVTTVAYEGTKKYLGRWGQAVQAACHDRGWQFVVNPPDLRDADLIVALRDGIWNGWMCREWKSGVKIVNAIAAGRPIIGQSCAAWRELAPAGTVVESFEDIGEAFDHWTDRASRADVAQVSAARWSTWALPVVADRMREILQGVVRGRLVAA